MNIFSIQEVNSTDILQNIRIYTEIIFRHFIELTQHQYVKHDRKEIYKMLTSDDMYGYIVRKDSKIIAYLFGEKSVLQDGRNSYYLSYIYVVPKYQHMKIGSILMKRLISNCKHEGLQFIILTCDTQDKKVMHFYEKFGFVYDPLLRNNKQHDVLCLYL